MKVSIKRGFFFFHNLAIYKERFDYRYKDKLKF